MARPQYNIIFMRRFHCQLNSALRQPSPAPPANRLVYTSNNAGDWPTKAVSNNKIENDGLMDRYLHTGTHEAIVSDEMFEAVQQEKLRRSKSSENTLSIKQHF